MSYANTIKNKHLLSGYSSVKLSQLTGIERTRLNRIISGEFSARFEELSAIADVLMIDDNEKKQLFDDFLADKLGAAKLQNWETILSFLRDMDTVPKYREYDGIIDLEHFSFKELTLPKESLLIKGKHRIYNAITAVLEDACLNDSPVDIIDTPKNNHLFSQLYHLVSAKKDTVISHILLLSDKSEADFSNTQTISAAKNIYPLFLLSQNYMAYYNYTNLAQYALMPFFVLTNRFSLNIANDFRSAVITSNKDIIRTHKELFETQKRISSRFVNKIDSPEKYIEYYCRLIARRTLLDKPSVHYSIDCEPFILSFLDAPKLEALFDRGTTTSGVFIQTMQNLYNPNKIVSKQRQILFFTKKNLMSFVETGKIQEAPKSFGIEFAPEHRKTVLKKLLSYMRSEKKNAIECRIINDEELSIPKGLRFIGNGSEIDRLFFITEEKNGEKFIVDLANPEVVSSVFNFVQAMTNSSLVLSEADTIQYIECIVRSM